MPSVKRNFLYSSILTTANYIFPVLTFPYVTRVLGVNNLGICDFVDSVINYFIIFSTMGVGVVGIREIATAKEDKARLSQTFSNLIGLNGVFTFLSIVILILVTIFVPKLYEHSRLMVFGGFKIVFNFLLIEWFYKGLEDFKYITKRTIIVKCLYVVSVFIFIKREEDYWIYYLLSILMIGINAIINMTHSKKFISVSKFKFRVKTYLKPFITYGAYSTLTSFYTTFNVAYLGFAADTTQVGYYTTATRLYTIFIALFSAFTGVMMPRMSSLLVEGKYNQFKTLYSKSLRILISITIPAIIFTIYYAPQIINLIAGKSFGGAIFPMRIVMPLLFIIGYEQILVIQALMPLKKDTIILRNSAIGAVVGILANTLVVSHLGAVGSAIVWVSCEIIILVLSQIAINKIIGEKFPFSLIAKNVVLYLPLVLIFFAFSKFDFNGIVLLGVGVISLIMYFIFINFVVFKDSLSADLLNKFK